MYRCLGVVYWKYLQDIEVIPRMQALTVRSCRQEFAQAMHAMGLRLTDEQRTMLFQEYDTDGNGTIDIAEFTHMVKRYLCKPGACQSVDETSSDETGGSSQDHTLYKQRWFAHDTAWDPSAIEIQRWARTGLARKQHDVALATQQQQDLQRFGPFSLPTSSPPRLACTERDSVRYNFAKKNPPMYFF